MTDKEAVKYAIQDLISSNGWQYVESFIKNRVDDCKAKLVTCKLDEVMDNRSKIIAYGTIDSFIKEALEDPEEHENNYE